MTRFHTCEHILQRLSRLNVQDIELYTFHVSNPDFTQMRHIFNQLSDSSCSMWENKRMGDSIFYLICCYEIVCTDNETLLRIDNIGKIFTLHKARPYILIKETKLSIGTLNNFMVSDWKFSNSCITNLASLYQCKYKI